MKTWEECNKPYSLTREYFRIRGENVFSSGKPNSNFWRVYAFFKKQDTGVLNLLHEYLQTIEEEIKLSMRDLFVRASKWNTATKVTTVTETQRKNYMSGLQTL